MVLNKAILKKAAPVLAAVALTVAVFGISATATNNKAEAAPVADTAEYSLKIEDKNIIFAETGVQSFSWGKDGEPGVELAVSGPIGGGSGTGKAKVSQIHFTQNVSKASPVLMKSVAEGRHYEKATLKVRKKDKQQTEFIVVTMSDVLVSSYRLTGQDQGLPTDEFSLSFSGLRYDYQPQTSDAVFGEIDLGL